MTTMSDDVIVVTGASGGLGLATTRILAARGATVAMVDLNEDSLDLAIATLSAAGIVRERLRGYAADVTDVDQVEDYFGRIRSDLGDVSGLFNNAGIEGPAASIADCPIAEFERVLAVNVKGVFLNLQHAIRAMRAHRRGGSIVNTGSGASLVGTVGAAPYVASKHAVLGLTRVAALETAREGIRVTCVCPGPVNTQMMQRIEDQSVPGPASARSTIESQIPMGRYGRVDEVAELVSFLLSDASSYITGVPISIDGGLTSC